MIDKQKYFLVFFLLFTFKLLSFNTNEVMRDFKGFTIPQKEDFDLIKSERICLKISGERKEFHIEEYSLKKADSIKHRDIIVIV